MTSSSRHYKRAVALLLMLAAYLGARPAGSSKDDLVQSARSVRFEYELLGDGPLPLERHARRVAPSLDRISSWISSVGAAVALADIDGDGLPNDACHVDPRTDTVSVRPVPHTGDRYAPIILRPVPPPGDSATAPMGCLPGDMNEDGRMDLLVYFWGRTPVAFLNYGEKGHPVFVQSEIVPGGCRWFTNAATFADVDGDGHFDLLIGNYFPDGAHILDTEAVGSESMQESMSRAANGGTKHLLRWVGVDAGMPRFQEVKDWIDPALRYGWTLALAAADLDGDLRPELYFANDFGPDQVLHNRTTTGHVQFVALHGRRGWTTPASSVMGADSFKGMGVDVADVNGDSWPDIYVSNIAEPFALEESHLLFLSTNHPELMQRGIAPYTEQSEAMGVARSSWAWDAKFADFDNDGTVELVQATGFVHGDVNRWPELHELAMTNDALLRDPRHWPRFQPGTDLGGDGYLRMFVRQAAGTFHDVSSLAGTRQPQITRGIAVADVDGDGRLDFAAANQWQPSVFYRNVSENQNMFLGLHILFAPGDGTTVPRYYAGPPQEPGSPVVGASVDVRRPDGSHIVSQVDGGNGHSGKRSADIHIGLGTTDPGQANQTVISWRDATGVRRITLQLGPGWYTVWLPRH
jgi:hypothetical protein